MPRGQDRGTGLCLLSIDPGGLRGISQLKILTEIMHRLNSGLDGDDIDSPCAVFNMIGGVGSGGFIAILLVVLGLTVSQALQEFVSLSTTILDGRVKPEARMAALKDYIGALLAKYNLEGNFCLLDRNERSRNCKLIIPISYKDSVHSMRMLRNFDVRTETTLNVTIAEAMLATIATPPSFSPIVIFKDSATFRYITGDLTISNLVREILVEAHRTFDPDQRIACLLSLGCGHPGVFTAPDGSSLAQWNEFLSSLIKDREKVAESADLQMGHIGGLYHRFSVNRGLEISTLSTGNTSEMIATHTTNYFNDVDISEKVLRCVEALALRGGASSLEQLVRSGGEKVVAPVPLHLTPTFVMRMEPWAFIEKGILGTTDAGVCQE